MCFLGMIIIPKFFILYFILFIINLLGTLGAVFDLYAYYTTYYKTDLDIRKKKEFEEKIKDPRKVR
jgi:hypothetical protein